MENNSMENNSILNDSTQNHDTQNNNVEKKSGSSGFKKGIACGVAVTLAVTLAGAGVVKGISHVREEKSTVISAGIGKDTKDKIKLIGNIIDKRYLYAEDLDKTQLQDGIYNGFVNAVGDPYTVYYNEEETAELFESTSGEYSGIGAVLSQDIETGEVVVNNVYPDSPAEKGGLMNGDRIYQVDDHVIEQGEDLSEIVSTIRGEKGTELVLHVYRGTDNEIVECTIVRDIVEAETVSHEMLDNNIGYLRITEFDQVTLEQFHKHMDALAEEGMQGLVIDLRANPGGGLETTVQILQSILPEGVIVSTKDRAGNTKSYTSDEGNTFDKPLAVLVDGYSASAAEIFAGAVQDTETGTIVGTTTFGKGIVQEILNLGDGTSLKVTISEYFTPSGKNIHGKGIVQDVVVEFPEDLTEVTSDIQLDKAVEIVEEQINQ